MKLEKMTEDEIKEQLEQINESLKNCEQGKERNQQFIEVMEKMFKLTKNREFQNNIDQVQDYNKQYDIMITQLLETQQLYLNHLKYMPGGKGADEAHEHFNLLVVQQ